LQWRQSRLHEDTTMSGRLRILVAAAAISVAPMLSACAYAQYGSHRDVDRYGRASFAFDTGYERGWHRGEQDARQRRAFYFQNDHDYRRGDRGYTWRYGSRDAYRYDFRRGYELGYRDGYNSRGRVGYGTRAPGQVYRGGSPRGVYRSLAADHGFREGYEKGIEDARRNRRHDPVGHRWYREGDRHYDRRSGSRDQWKDEYRRAFREGYERGYRERW
jgi:hypothetical protein